MLGAGSARERQGGGCARARCAQALCSATSRGDMVSWSEPPCHLLTLRNPLPTRRLQRLSLLPAHPASLRPPGRAPGARARAHAPAPAARRGARWLRLDAHDPRCSARVLARRTPYPIACRRSNGAPSGAQAERRSSDARPSGARAERRSGAVERRAPREDPAALQRRSKGAGAPPSWRLSGGTMRGATRRTSTSARTSTSDGASRNTGSAAAPSTRRSALMKTSTGT